jgi:hypothetical protein
MGLGWFDAIASAAMPVYSGIQQGNLAAEELKRKRAEEALRSQLLQAQIASYQDRTQKWEPTSYQEAVDYELATNPQRITKPEGSTVQPEWVKEGFPDQESYLDWLGKKSRRQFPERFTQPPRATDVTQQSRRNQGLAYLEQFKPGQTATPEQIAQADAFHEAFRAIRSGNADLDPGLVSYQALESARRSQPELWRAGNDDNLGGFEAEYLRMMREGGGGDLDGATEPVAPVAPVAPAAPAPPPAPAAPAAPAPPSPPGLKRPVSQDQADYLRAIGRWDDARYEVQ